MKFPKSVHPEGWLDHIDTRSSGSAPAARPAGTPLKPRMPRPAGAKIRATDPIGYVSPEPMAASVPPIHASVSPAMAAPGANPARRSSNSMPWVLGVGAGVVLIGVAVTMSRQFTTDEAPALPPTVVGEVTPPAVIASSPEDTLLAEAPPAAGTVTPETTPVAPAEPATQVAAAPKAVDTPKVVETPKPAEAPKLAQAPKVEAPAPVVTRTLTPPPEALAQVAPPPVTLQPTPVAPVAPVVTPPVTEAQPVQPPVLAQQTPPVTPPVANPEDTGITIKVREALASDSTLAVVPIAVSTDHGVVKLEGQAPDAPTKERATVVAAATSGVRGVDNRLTLPPVTVGVLMQNSGS
ncbi:BON domain-containing protein [Roseateles asaccharophilus]|uniref:BON domain-containing protein n=1 Tax=Roseateles asaccharophilus TaxID=582607 RepID=A0ABU2A1E2_9BURK|nr:BON domain-containing protein [Roseateles asaccharophilus]MDR7331007.1 hypothetical protein [Roseateles asaccharophilus]